MKRFGRWLAVIAAVIAVLVVAAIILVKVLVTPERVRATVQPLAEKALHRQVTLGDIQIGLFSGVQLADLRIVDTTGKEDFVAAEKVVLRYQLWPLLLGRVRIDQVQLVGPRIRIVRNADGRFNFDDLLGKPGPGQEQTAPQESAPVAAAGAIDLHISHIGLSGGEVVFLDYTVDHQAPYRLKFSTVDLDLKDVSLTRNFPFELQGMLNDARLSIDGEANIRAASGKARLQLTDLDATGFAPYLRGKIPGTLRALKVSADLKVAGDARQVTSSGQITLGNLAMTLDALPKVPLQNATLKLDYDLNLDLAGQKLTVAKGHLDFNGIRAEVSGAVADYAKSPRLDLQLALPGLDLRQTLDALPAGLVAKTDGLDPAGKVDLQVHLVGSPQRPAELPQEGTLKLSSVQASVAGIRPALNGVLTLKGRAVTSQGLQLVAGDNRADLDLRIADFTARPIAIFAGFSADQLAIDPLLGSAAPAKGNEAPSAQAPGGKGTEPGPLDLPVRAEASLKVKKATVKGLTCQDLVLHGLLAKNVLTVDDLHGQLAGGRFQDTARVDLGQPGFSYRTHLVLNGLQFQPLAAAFAPKLAGTVTGGLDLDTELAGKGTLPEAVKRSLTGRGEFTVKDGRLEGGQLVQGLATFLALDDLRQLSFQQWAGNFRIDQGQVQFDSQISGKQVRLAPKGTVGLDGKLNLLLDARLSPELTAKLDRQGNISRYFKDAEGWGQVPLKLTGSVDRPSFEIDTRAAVQKAGEKLQQKLQEKLLERLGPKKDSESTPESPPKQPLEKTLRGLFGN